MKQNTEEIFNKWLSTGFLGGLEEDEQRDLAPKFEEVVNLMLKTHRQHFWKGEPESDLDITILPITRRVNTALFKVGKQNLFNAEELVNYAQRNFSKSKVEIEQISEDINIDAEAMACKIVSDNIVANFIG